MPQRTQLIYRTEKNGFPRQLRSVTPLGTTTATPMAIPRQIPPQPVMNIVAQQQSAFTCQPHQSHSGNSLQGPVLTTPTQPPSASPPQPKTPSNPDVQIDVPQQAPSPVTFGTMPSMYTQQQQQQQQPPPQQQFAVIASDPAALQALLSGDLGGRTFIIQPLPPAPLPPQHLQQQPYFQAPYYPNSGPPAFAIQQAPPLQPAFQVTPITQSWTGPGVREALAAPPQPTTEQKENPSHQQQKLQQPQLSPPLPVINEPPLVTIDLPTPPGPSECEKNVQVLPEPVFVVTTPSKTSAASPPLRSPPRSLQSIFKPEEHQNSDIHKVAHRLPQKLGTPAFLQAPVPTSTPSQRETTPKNLRQQSPLAEYAEKLRNTPLGRKRKEGKRNTMKCSSMPESEHLQVISGAMGDKSVLSVIDRARLWQQERRIEEERMKRSGFVDRDLVACGDELVPVEERVRAFDTGQVLEESAAASRLLNEQFEEQRNRRILEQSFTTGIVTPQPPPHKTKAPSQQSPLSTGVTGGDTLSR